MIAASALSWAQYSGWACVFCGASLAVTGGVSAGRAQGRSGSHDLSIEMYACPPLSGCVPARLPQTPAPYRRAGQTPPTGGAVHNRRKT
ncbi:hypothetical protein ACIQ6R_18425 [Streptomyces sp. NPDC096048]|uniref:hypothetical protein n=1 Tax=Streptomyces sp. NPDC096048 TaxID=3366072 RepID=UPI0037F3C8C4